MNSVASVFVAICFGIVSLGLVASALTPNNSWCTEHEDQAYGQAACLRVANCMVDADDLAHMRRFARQCLKPE